MPNPEETPATATRCPDGDDRVVMVAVTVDRAARTITVVPETVTVTKDGGAGKALRVCWTIAGMADGDKLKFDDKGGGQPDYFPGMNRTVPSAHPYANSGNPAKTGKWTYSLELKDASGQTVATKDPDVIIQPGP